MQENFVLVPRRMSKCSPGGGRTFALGEAGLGMSTLDRAWALRPETGAVATIVMLCAMR